MSTPREAAPSPRSRWAEAARELQGVVGATTVFFVALLVFGLQSLCLSLALGRDAEDYVIHGWEVFAHDPLFPRLMVARTPVSGLLIDLFDWLGGAVGVEVGLALLFAASVACWVMAARAWGRRVALVTLVLLVVVPAHGVFFHRVSSDPVFAAVLSGVGVLSIRLVQRPSHRRAAALGAAIATLVLTRPSGQPFLLLSVLPLGVAAMSWRSRIGRSISVAGVSVLLLGAWAVSNGIRYGEFSVAHGGKSGVPLYRVFVIDPKVERANGPATRAVADAVERRLLAVEPYRSLGFDADELLAAGNVWALDDIVFATEAEYGPSAGAGTLFRAGVEGVRADLLSYVKGVGLSLTGLLLLPYAPGVADVVPGSPLTSISDAVLGPPGRGRRLPPEVGGEPSIWAQAMIKSWGLEATDRYRITGGLRPLPDAIWPSLERRALTWRGSVDVRRYAELRARLRTFVDGGREGDRAPGAARALRVAAFLLPSSGFWLLLGLVFAVRRRPRGLWAPAVLALASLVVLLQTALSFPPHPDYALPFVPAFMLLAFAAMSGRRISRAPVPTVGSGFSGPREPSR